MTEQDLAGIKTMDEAIIARLGIGAYVIDTGVYGGAPAVFIKPAEQPGVQGESAAREQGQLDVLEPGERVIIAASPEHAKAIADAFVLMATPSALTAATLRATKAEEAERGLREALTYIAENDPAYLKAPIPGAKGYPGHLAHVARAALQERTS